MKTMKRDCCFNDLQKEQRALELLSSFASTINNIKINQGFSLAVNALIQVKGKVITTGMGKAGIAMRKFSSTLCSLGFPSCYLHPGEASHGDLGVIVNSDILFVASTSGKTREVLETIQLARNICVSKVIGITSHIDSPIREKADICLDMGIIKEAGDLGLAPTSSILTMIAITDSLALVASESIGLTKEQYGTYHHSGYLGAIARGDNFIY